MKTFLTFKSVYEMRAKAAFDVLALINFVSCFFFMLSYGFTEFVIPFPNMYGMFLGMFELTGIVLAFNIYAIPVWILHVTSEYSRYFTRGNRRFMLCDPGASVNLTIVYFFTSSMFWIVINNLVHTNNLIMMVSK